jgi:intein/homing endonuclease
MKRVKLAPLLCRKYFNQCTHHAHQTNSELAGMFRVSSKTVRDWKRGKHSFPIQVAEYFSQYKISLPSKAEIIDENEQKSRIGRIGALRRLKLYGPPGTPEGRSLGGKRSLITHKRLGTAFHVSKKFPILEHNENLAELIGISLGDGHLSKGQLQITSDINEQQYSLYISKLMNKLFQNKSSIYERSNARIVCISGENLVKQLNALGLVCGNKVKNQVRIPDWIRNNQEFYNSCLKGLFDTDGCIFIDKHNIKETNYSNIGIAYTSFSKPLLRDIFNGLSILGLHPTISTPNRIMVRRKKDVIAFFEQVNPNNAKHQLKYNRFMEA